MNTETNPASRTLRPLVVLLTLVAVIAASACSAPSRDAAAPSSSDAPVTVVDDAGRTVELAHPFRSAVVANRYNVELIRAMGSIGAVKSVDLNTAQDRAYWPQFDPANVIGKSQSEINLEKVIELKPEALIIPKNSPVDEYARKLDGAGIKTIVVTGWDNASLPKQMTVLGKAFGRPDGAQKVTDLFTGTIKKVSDRVSSQSPKKTVYWEYGDPNTTAIPGTSNDGWHNMIVSAGGVNIFGDPNIKGDTIDPEAVLRANPDLIVKTTSGGALKNTGRYTPPADGEFARIGAEMVARPGWAQLNAVRAGNTHLMTGFLGGGLGKAVGTVYVAKWLYPEQMKDVDPNAVFDQWLDLQGVKPVAGHTYDVPAVR
ncbi:ABC transporter substrate-binding protein [Tsukamurella pseudospumae]|uniref:ABC transporter substrate-binding protein n=1 Tax=Tsukamurella pseudospumae TaxID=239498 RepID=UPI000A8C3EAB|nr:ABC transporter substrate-binding protein [Tsukamurella pseudospumae]